MTGSLQTAHFHNGPFTQAHSSRKLATLFTLRTNAARPRGIMEINFCNRLHIQNVFLQNYIYRTATQQPSDSVTRLDSLGATFSTASCCDADLSAWASYKLTITDDRKEFKFSAIWHSGANAQVRYTTIELHSDSVAYSL